MRERNRMCCRWLTGTSSKITGKSLTKNTEGTLHLLLYQVGEFVLELIV